MQKISVRQRFRRGCLVWAAAVVGGGLISGPVSAADLSVATQAPTLAPVPDVAPAFDVAFGTRYWMGFGSTAKDLYDIPGTSLVSRLTYKDFVSHSGELFGEIKRSAFFVKGFAGLGGIVGGSLQDEDFPPFINPYSSTDSNLRGGYLSYGTVDVGFNFYDMPTKKLGAFVGYNFLNQDVNAFGCVQTATHPGICVPSIADSIAVISQSNNWQSVRLGLKGEVMQGQWRLRGRLLCFLMWHSVAQIRTG